MGRRPKQTFPQRRHMDGQKPHENMFNITNYQRNTNKRSNEVSLHISQNHQKSTKIYGEESVEKRGPSHNISGNVNQYSHYGEQYGGSLKNRATMCIQQSYSCAYIQRKPYFKNTCTPIFIVVLFIIAKTWKQPKCWPTDEWVKKMLYIYTMEYYSDIN